MGWLGRRAKQMPNSLHMPRVRAVLDRLFAAAPDDQPPTPFGSDVSWASATLQKRADASANIYMPISASGGQPLYALVRASRPEVTPK